MPEKKIQVIRRTQQHINDVIPTQTRRGEYVEFRLDNWTQRASMLTKLSSGKTATP